MLRLLPKRIVGDDESDQTPTDGETPAEAESEHQQIWEHVKTLRKRVAGFN